MAQLSIPAGHKVIQQGDDVTYDDCMFLVEEDSVEVRIAAAQQTSLFESVGFIFGDWGALFGGVRSASVFSTTPVKLTALSRRDLLSMLPYLPVPTLLLFLRNLTLLQGLTDNQIVNLTAVTHHKRFSSGQLIIRYGAKSDSLYIVVQEQQRLTRCFWVSKERT